MFFSFRGHGGSSPAPHGWDYADLAGDLRTVADAHGATRALGVSMGAGALCRILSEQPDRFDRLVFFLPAVLDTPRAAPARERFAALAAALDDPDPAVLEAAVAVEVPPVAVRTPAARAYVRQRVAALRGHGGAGGISGALRALPELTALPDAEALRKVVAPALVLACQDDPQHPVEVAERLAGLLPASTLHVWDEPGVLWTRRADLRARIARFLNA